MAASGIAVGINKGHIVTRRVLKAKPSNKIGVCIQKDGWMNFLIKGIGKILFFCECRKSEKKKKKLESIATIKSTREFYDIQTKKQGYSQYQF